MSPDPTFLPTNPDPHYLHTLTSQRPNPFPPHESLLKKRPNRALLGMDVQMLQASRQSACTIWNNQLGGGSQKEVFRKLQSFQQFVAQREAIDGTPRTIGEDLMDWGGFLYNKGTIMPRVISNYMDHVKSAIRLTSGEPVRDLMLPSFQRSLRRDPRNRPVKRAYAILKTEVDTLVTDLVNDDLPNVAAFAALAWTTAGRLSDILRLRPQDVLVEDLTVCISWHRVKDDPQGL
eukprot:gene14060-4125_t